MRICFWAVFFSFLTMTAGIRADESYFLGNGLKVILAPRPESPVVSVRVLVKAGSAEEGSPSEYGLAHLNEHMAFQTTAKRKVGEIAGLVEKNGGNYNAYTSFDETAYFINLPADAALLALDLLSDMVFAPAYDPEEFASEKEVVVEEMRRRRDNPTAAVYDRFMEIAYPGHPYGRPVIGNVESVRGVSIEEAEAFHAAFYRPDNAVLVIAGGFDAASMKAAILRHFGGVPKPATPPVRPVFPSLPESGGLKIAVEKSPRASLAKAYIGFRGFAAGDPRSVQADILASILSSGRASRLEEAVKNRQGLVGSIGAYSDSSRGGGIFIIALDAPAEKIPAAVGAALAELENIFAEPFKPEEIEKSRALLKLSLLQKREEMENVARLLTDFEYAYGDWRLLDGYLPRWDRTSSADLVRLAAELFTPDRLAVAALLPEGADDCTDGLEEAVGSFDPGPLPECALPVPEFVKMNLLPGIDLRVMRDPRRDLVSINAGVAGGLFAEDEETAGIGGFMANVWPRATLDRNSTELSLAVERLGAWISALSGQSSFRLSGSFVKENWKEGLALFAETLTRPAFDPANVEEARREILAAIARRDEQPATRAYEMANKTLYGGHPYGRDVLGTRGSVASITAGRLAEHYRRFIHPGKLTIAVAGDVDPSAVRDALAGALRGWKTDFTDAAPPAAAPEPLAAPELRTDARDLAQTQIVFGFQGPGIDHPDAPALSVLLGHLSRSGGPLYMELREKRSLAYAVGGGFRPGVGAGDIKFSIGADPSKAVAAFSGMREILERTARDGVARNDVEDAKKYILGHYKFARQTLDSLTGGMLSNLLYGFGEDFDEKNMKAIAAVAVADVRRVAKQYLDFDKAAFAVVGTEASLEAVDNLVGE